MHIRLCCTFGRLRLFVPLSCRALVAIWERAHRRGGFGRQEGVEAEVLAFERRIDVPILDRGSGDALVEEKLMFVQSQEEDGVLPLVRAGKIANAVMEEYHADASCWERFSKMDIQAAAYVSKQ